MATLVPAALQVNGDVIKTIDPFKNQSGLGTRNSNVDLITLLSDSDDGTYLAASIVNGGINPQLTVRMASVATPPADTTQHKIVYRVALINRSDDNVKIMVRIHGTTSGVVYTTYITISNAAPEPGEISVPSAAAALIQDADYTNGTIYITFKCYENVNNDSGLELRIYNLTMTYNPFDPATLSPAVWLRAIGPFWQDSARTTAATADNDPVGAWDDVSGNAKHAIQATSTKRGTLKLALINSKDVVLFDGVDDYLTIGNLSSITSAAEIFLIIKKAVDPSASSAKSGLWHFSFASSSTHFPFTDGTIYDAFATTARKTTVDPTPSLAAWRLYNVVSQSAEWTSRLDGTQIFTTGTNTFNTLPTTPDIGRDNSAHYLDGWVAELLLFSSVLSSTNRNNVEAYFASEFNLSIS